MMLRHLSREPLLHFFVLGAGLFLIFAWLNRGAMEAADEVVVDGARIDSFIAQFERVWQRPPTASELRGLIDNWVREEILYREGVALGLDVNDTIVRRRIAQKMTFIADGAVPPEPTHDQLEDWLQLNMDRYRLEPIYSLRQVYFDRARHGQGLRERLIELQSTLSDTADVPEGDATSLPARIDSWSEREFTRAFGTAFTEALVDLAVGAWEGPVESAFGLHLVRIDEKVPAREPELAEVRDSVERDWSAEQAEKLNQAFYDAIRQRYTVQIIAGEMAAAIAPADPAHR